MTALRMWFVPIARPGHYSDGWLVVAAASAGEALLWAGAVLGTSGVTVTGQPTVREVA